MTGQFTVFSKFQTLSMRPLQQVSTNIFCIEKKDAKTNNVSVSHTAFGLSVKYWTSNWY